MPKYDLQAVEERMRKDIALAGAAGIEMIQGNQTEAEFLRAQRMFDEARIQFLLACMRAENEGIDRNMILSAAGHAIGSIWTSALSGCVGERERAVVNGWARKSFAQVLGLDPNDKVLMSVFQAQPDQALDG